MSVIKQVKRSQRKEHVDYVLATCGIQDVASRPIGVLSKGYRQRTGIAQALIGDPEVLILDEPTVGLDPKQISEIRELIKSMAGEKTIILSSHILPEVSMLADRVVIINNGKIVRVDTPQNLHAQHRSSKEVDIVVRGTEQELRTCLSTVSNIVNVDTVRSADGIVQLRIATEHNQDIRGIIARTVSQTMELLELKPLEVSLEDVFIQLVTEEGQTHE